VKRTIQILTPHISYGTTGLVNFAGNSAFSFRTLITLLTTMHFLFAAIGMAQQEQTGKKVGNTGQMKAQSTVPANMPDFSTGEFTLEQAKNALSKDRQERIESKSGPSDLPVGKIYAQDPTPGTPLRPDTRITLFVSTGPSQVPSTTSTADISVVKTLVTKGPYLAGKPIQYTIVVSNAGPSTANNVQIVDTPMNIKLDDVSGECSALPCTIKSIEAHSSSEPITVTATIIAAGAFDNSVTVTAAESDPSPNNTDNLDNGGNASSSVDVSATEQLDTLGPFRAGQTVQYTLIVSNAGPSNATNIRIDERPTNLTITNVSLKTREVSEPCNEFPCTIANLAANEVATITVTASIDREGSFGNAAEVTAAEHDADPRNNNIPNSGGIATSAPPPPPPNPFPPLWVLILILVVAGSGVAGGGTYVIWHWLRPTPGPPTPPPVSPPPPPVSPLPPVPVVNPSVNLEPGRSSVDGLRMTGPEIHLRTSLEMGGSIFDGPVPIIRREVINE
jgi:uncharacterized repeat protein (TIGR01451 family)